MRALLKRYACPVPYHHVRARFMGNIATPDMDASPMKEIQRLWNDDLPEFADTKEAEAFFGALLQGLWNGLSAHQSRWKSWRGSFGSLLRSLAVGGMHFSRPGRRA